jgi:CBS domain-containing protein
MKTVVRDVMTSPVVWVKKDAPYKEIAARLRENRVSAFPVLDDEGKVIGVVSEADLLTKEALDGGYDGMPGMITGLLRRKEQEKARGTNAGDLMTYPALTIPPGAPVENAARLMYKSKVKSLPVVDSDGHLTGIISRADVLSAFGRSDPPQLFPHEGMTVTNTTGMKTTVKEIMTTQVVAVKLGASFKEMAAALRDNRISAFPVIDDDGRVIGVVSEADMLAKEVLNADHAGTITAMVHRREQDKADGLTARDLMTHPAVTVTPYDSVEQAARLMYTLLLKRLPVIDHGGVLVGIISRTDVLAVYDRPDDEIRQEIIGNVIVPGSLQDPDRFTVGVQAGVVTLAGRPESVVLGRDLVHKIRHVQGVVAVRDLLSYPEAYPTYPDMDPVVAGRRS